MGNGMRDNALKLTKALPNGAAAVTSDALDLQLGSRGDHVVNVELVISAPAMGATPMPDDKTMKYDIIHSDNADLGTPSTLVAAAITQTGAGGVGCAAAEYRFRFPVDVKRYVGVKATGSASGNATTASLTAELVF